VKRLGQVYTQLEAPVGPLGLATLRASTRALEGTRAAYTRIENRLQRLGAARDRVAGRIRQLLLAAEFSGHPVKVPAARGLVSRGEELLREAASLAG
jgi:hypothetical protein